MPISQEKKLHHVPVMTPEVLDFLNIREDGVYIDGTIGAGGHALSLIHI